MSKFIDLTGQKFGKLTVIKRVENGKNGQARWLCECECGNKIIIYSSNLKRELSKSCGQCLKRQGNLKHGFTRNRIYNIWKNIKSRCKNLNNLNYKYYGERGIIICDEWLNDFMNFYNWAMANGYQENLTIDRIDVNGNYCPENCRWITPKKQANNRRNNLSITYNGKTQSLKLWCEELHLQYNTTYDRIKHYNWSIEKAFSNPILY